VDAVETFKEGQRRTWASGDFPSIATIIQPAADALIERIGVGAGQDLLDVATGSGNVAVEAARRGARVTGLDLVPELLEAARARAEQAGVDVEWRVGDAEELPFEDGSFDRVTSTFGTMFAPRHQRTADELIRVTRPGGVIGVAAWTPEGLNGEMFTVLGAHMPPPPPGIESPILWGDEGHVRELFSGDGREVSCERLAVNFDWESVDGWVSYCEQVLGPTIMAKSALEPDGRWDAARADLVALYDRYNQATDGTLRSPAEYLLTIVAA
jgi:SAM-dependent methyltransferase